MSLASVMCVCVRACVCARVATSWVMERRRACSVLRSVKSGLFSCGHAAWSQAVGADSLRAPKLRCATCWQSVSTAV